jgi:hypothetical protein
MVAKAWLAAGRAWRCGGEGVAGRGKSVVVTSCSAAWRRAGAHRHGDAFVGGEGVTTASSTGGISTARQVGESAARQAGEPVKLSQCVGRATVVGVLLFLDSLFFRTLWRMILEGATVDRLMLPPWPKAFRFVSTFF